MCVYEGVHARVGACMCMCGGVHVRVWGRACMCVRVQDNVMGSVKIQILQLSSSKSSQPVNPHYLSNDSPHAMTEISSGSPMGSNISGRNTPEFPTSTHFFRPVKREEEREEEERGGEKEKEGRREKDEEKDEMEEEDEEEGKE